MGKIIPGKAKVIVELSPESILPEHVLVRMESGELVMSSSTIADNIIRTGWKMLHLHGKQLAQQDFLASRVDVMNGLYVVQFFTEKPAAPPFPHTPRKPEEVTTPKGDKPPWE
jgi:hypothetical protein